MSVIENAIAWAVGIARDNTHGYDQIHRWLNPDVDCSSLVVMSFEQAGVPVKENGASYTGNMRAAFVKCGFEAIPYKKGMTLYKGDVLLNEKHHTALYIGDGLIVQASCNEKGGIYNGKGGDQTGREVATGKFYEYSKGWDYVLRYSEEVQTVSVILPVLKRGSKCPEVGMVQTLLNALGYVGKSGKPLATDHDYGANTEYAVINFQKSHGMNGDGITGEKTYNALLRADY